MRQITYTMHFRGQASPSAEDGKILRMTSCGTSSTMQTVVGPTGVETTWHAVPGDMAFVEAEIRVAAQDAFDGKGVLTFGDDGEHELRFATLHAGHLGPSAVPGIMTGSVSWAIQGGTGRFQSSTGIITSAFTLTDSGELSEYQCGLIFVAE